MFKCWPVRRGDVQESWPDRREDILHEPQSWTFAKRGDVICQQEIFAGEGGVYVIFTKNLI